MSKRITKIERQNRRTDRCSVYIDDEFAFGLSEEILFKRKIRLHQELDDDEIDALLLEDERSRAKTKAIELLSYRDHSKKELSLKLTKRGFKKEIVDWVGDEMQMLGYLDDEAFAKSFARNRILQKQVGRRELAYQLKQKGVSEAIAQKTLENLYREFDERILAERLVEKRIQTFRRQDPSKSKKSLIDYLYRKGFGWEVIEEILSRYHDIIHEDGSEESP